MMNSKRLLGISVIVCLVFGFAAMLWAAKCPEEWSRLNPLMDYVPQNAGIYDTVYDEFLEPDCRGCHGASLADRHHLASSDCFNCHPVPGVAEHDCRAAGCHATVDNGGHHQNNLSATMQCDACHSQLAIGGYVPEYPPGITMPRVFSCENCHWEQLVPMEGGSPIYAHQDLHHNFDSNFVGNCYWCHAGNDPYGLSWDPDLVVPYDDLVRNCEKCHGDCAHGVGYSGYTPHMGIPETGFYAWEAAGWHVDSPECGDVDPTVNRLFKNGQPEPPVDELCWGCHGDRY